MKITILIEDDNKPDMGFVTMAGPINVLDLNAPIVITAISDFALKALGELQKEVDRQCAAMDVVAPNAEDHDAILKTIRLRDLKVQFEENLIPRQPK